MNDWDAFDASVPNHWHLYIDPLTIDLDLFDIADAVGDLLEEALDAALDTILGPLPQWAKDLITAILGPIIDVVRAILTLGTTSRSGSLSSWASASGWGTWSSNCWRTISRRSGRSSSCDPVPVLQPQVLPATPLIPVLVPMEFIGVQVTGEELILEADIGG